MNEQTKLSPEDQAAITSARQRKEAEVERERRFAEITNKHITALTAEDRTFLREYALQGLREQ